MPTLGRVASDDRRLRILDSELVGWFPAGYASNLLARGIVPNDVFDNGLLPGYLACTRCNAGTPHPSMRASVEGAGPVVEPYVPPLTRWLLDGAVLVCLECGADLT